ncbi:MAG: hypothetical protein ONB24_13680 [candidate division KSB1 bacterium]|nr:hypothetical protein [candidate division KSB1 bacterium]
MKRVLSPLGMIFFIAGASALSKPALPDSILGHPVQRAADGRLLPWYQPHVPGAAYAHVAKLASEFIRDSVPVYDPLGVKMYFITCCFHQETRQNSHEIIPEDWMHNPACVWAGLVQGLVLDWRVYSGDESYIPLVREMLDFQLQHGTTPADWPWPNVPYASADPFVVEYQGATRWETDGMRGDGLHGIEPDKVGELGVAYLNFYKVTEEQRFLDAALHCADALATHVRDVLPPSRQFAPSKTDQSPWPFRVNARTGAVISEYCSNVIEPIRLFDELLRLRDRLRLTPEQAAAYQRARDLAWQWLYSINGPMKTYIWNAYFEDIPNDPDRSNRVQITPLETARYLIKHPHLDPDLEKNVPALIRWVASAFATEGLDAIKEQTWCYEPMGSHTARYASICALWYERTGDPWYKDQAELFFNLATYMCHENGVVSVGPYWPSSWWSDGYGDYIRHFMEGLAAVPEWAPDGDHLLRSTSAVQKITYQPKKIFYKTFDDQGCEVLRLTVKPRRVTAAGRLLQQVRSSDQEGWRWQSCTKGGVLRIKREGSPVVIEK